MKSLLKITALAIVLMLSSCSVESVNEVTDNTNSDPINVTALQNTNFQCVNGQAGARITNNGSMDVSLEIFDNQNNLIASIDDLNPGGISDWYYFQAGLITFSLESEDGKVKAPVIDMGSCMAFDMEIGENNQLVSDVAVQL